MASTTCEEYKNQENGKEDHQEDAVRRRKKNFQREVIEENAPEENGISNRLFSSTFIPPLAPHPGCVAKKSQMNGQAAWRSGWLHR